MTWPRIRHLSSLPQPTTLALARSSDPAPRQRTPVRSRHGLAQPSGLMLVCNIIY
ncbi:hypothetical protein IV505_00635 [Pseudomonas fulva]|nr:hypothetical protein [Pseudomonas fulva]MBF8778235.1 hypothetical protein [Pseudomonas fulva]